MHWVVIHPALRATQPETQITFKQHRIEGGTDMHLDFRSFANLGKATFIIALGFLSAPVTVAAQGATVIEEILVTATRRGETDIQTTPITVTAVSGEDFSKLFAQDIGEIASFVPNFSAATVTGFNAASFAMRGASETDIIVYFDPKVAVILDDFVVPHVQTQLLEPFDVESVEVLRGPQGTLFGKNTTAGAVVVRTKRPELDKTEAEASFQYGSYNDFKSQFSVNVPVADTLAFRFAGIYQKSDGYYKNGKVDTPTNAFASTTATAVSAAGPMAGDVGDPVRGDGSKIGGKDVISGRFKALWQPTDALSVLAQYEIIRDSSDPVPVVNTTPGGSSQLANLFGFPGIGDSGDPLDQAGIHASSLTRLDKPQRVDVDGGYLNVELDLGSHTFYGLAGYRYQESRLPNEYLGTPFDSFFSATRDDDRKTLQLEGRIASNNAERINYVAGAFYQQNDAEFCVLQQLGLLDFFGAIPGGAVPDILDNDNPLILCNAQDASSWAVFGDVTIDVIDRLQIGGGLRWTDEQKDYIAREGTAIFALGVTPDQLINGELDPLDLGDFERYPCNPAVSANCVQEASNDWGELTWRATVSYQFTEELFGYFTASRGFKSGGYNDQAGSGTFAQFPLSSYDPEFATNFEGGIKVSMLEGRFRASVSYFNVTYDDFQRSTVVSIPGTAFQETRTFNAATLDAQGIEFEGTLQIVDNLVLRANLGWLDATYDEFVLDRNANGMIDAGEDFSGKRPTRSPKHTGGLDLTYYHSLNSNLGDLRLNFNFNYEKENTYYYADDPMPGGQYDTVLEARTISNISVTWTSADGGWYVSAFGKNLSDDRYQTAAQSVGNLWTFSNYGPPRTFGVQVGAKLSL
ncbi:MAG: TonB-dependent receptor [Gammaproteobacteria bacterium]